MREILFRGKLTDNGEWVEGYYAVSGTESGTPNQAMILSNGGVMSYAGLLFHNVHPETVGQFTGLLDKNGNRVFEGDVFQVAKNQKYLVKWVDAQKVEGMNYETFYASFVLFQSDEIFFPFDEYAMKTGEVIGNIHDNPELINQ